MDGRLGRWLWVPEDGLPSWVLDALTLDVSRGRSGDQLERVKFFRRKDGWIGLPRQWGIYQARRLGISVSPPALPTYALPAPQLLSGALDPKRWEVQGPVVEAAATAIRREFGGIVEAECGFGKTILGMAIAARLGVPVLVLVGAASSDLADQWETTARQFCGEQAGRIQEGRCEIRPVTIATVQTLHARGLDKSLASSWGLAILDECHHLPAETFLRALHLVDAPYRLGLTATLRRSDGAEAACQWFLGRTVAVGKGISLAGRAVFTLSPARVSYGGILDWQGDRPRLSMSGKPRMDHTRLVRVLSADEAHNRWVTDLAEQAVDRGRQTLVLGVKIEHLRKLAAALHARRPGSAGLYVGKAPSRSLQIVDRAGQLRQPVTYATYGVAREALDIPHKDTLIFATPPGDPEQAAGRIRRFVEGKRAPLVFDLVPQHVRAGEGALRRAEVYRTMGLELHGYAELATATDRWRSAESAYLAERWAS